MPVFFVKERLCIRGLMPERALLRLRRAGIPLYEIKKIDEKTLLVSVEKRDVKKVFATYPQSYYNVGESSSFTVRFAPKKGLARWTNAVKKRVGLLLGGLLFLSTTAFADGFVFGVEFVGTSVYAREVYSALQDANVRLFAPYSSGKEDLVCAKILALDGVEFCSVQKRGMRLVVEIRTAPFSKDTPKNGELYSGHTGEIVSITVLSGTALKKKGDFVNAGESLVGDWFVKEDGGQVRVQAIARVCMACVYEGEFLTDSEEQAFATAYLTVGVDESISLTEREIQAMEGGFRVKLCYQVVQTINF